MPTKNEDKRRANELGMIYAKHIANMDDEVKQLMKGKGFWNSFHKGFKKGFEIATPVASVIAPEIAPELLVANSLVQASGKSKVKKKKTSGKRSTKKDKLAKLLAFVNSQNKSKGGRMNKKPKEIKLKYAPSYTLPQPVREQRPSPRPIRRPPALNVSNLEGPNYGTRGRGKKSKSRNYDKIKRRGMMVKKIMKEKGLKFIEASKYIKDNNIKY